MHAESLAGLRVLVLDDEPFILKLVTHMLAKLGFVHVTGCTSGGDALRRVDAPDSSPDLILCDLNMPEMDGVEFLRRLVEHGYGGSLILISGEDQRALHATESLARAHGIRVLGSLRKPASPADLSRLINLLADDRPRSDGPHHDAYSADSVRRAIRGGELVNHFQPQVDLADGRVHGVESLVRWQHPADGLVFPDQFIGIAEEHGLIDELTRLVLVDALAQARNWLDMGLPLRMAVNVSMENLVSLDFPDFVAAAAAAENVSPQMVALEVTESRLMQDVRAPLEILTRLRLKRFELSIDDFGTGHSSLTQLRTMPFDELKIDRSFVHGAATDETVRAIHDASMSLARQLGMTTVAEGVEDRRDWDFLRHNGCRLAQGYFIGRPMPAAAVPAWVREWNARLQRDLLLAD